MIRHRFAASLAFSLLAILGFASPVSAGEQVPFRGGLEGNVKITPLVPPFVSVLIEAAGNVNHLGHFTVDIPHVVNRSNSTAVGTYEFTAANGDTLTAHFIGQSMPTDMPGVLHIEEVAIITGGTGRFAGATGSFTVERWFDTVAGATVGSIEGTISSAGSNKR